MKKYFLILALLVSNCFCIRAQTIEYGLQGGFNLTFMNVQDDDLNLIFDSYILETTFGGFNLGGLLNLRYKSFSLRGSLGYQFSTYYYETNFLFTDRIGGIRSRAKKKIYNHSILFSPIFTHNVKGGFYYGSGISLAYLLGSRIRVPQIRINGEEPPNLWRPNFQYRKFTLAIPIVVGYEWDRHAIFVKYLRGITNKSLKGAHLEEKENTFILGYTFLLKNNSQEDK